MAWIIEGARMIIDLDYQLPTPACVAKAIAAYRNGSDWLQQFLEQCCEDGPGYEVGAGALYQEYVRFTKDTNSYARTAADFHKEVSTRGFASYKKQNRKFYKGLKLQDSNS